MSRIRNRQSSTSTTVKKPINKFIITGSSLNAVLDNIRKTAVVQGSAANERAVHFRLAHQLARVRWLHTATILDSHAPGNCPVEHRGQLLADEGVGVLRLLRRGVFARANGPDRFVSHDRFLHLFGG